ncbi:O-methyltransferase [Salicibibacter cibarius]|uniref:O-methyltransferase n=1 Tax=Salicibibacter cibarius TaxID=2743000 RepID=A0A7T6Z3L6_9BACI|nr:O-methyltransferase [Salicibibacter cibarius]QQK76161.1 O-methyltransferase [Salicibibacter cibarius]
MQSETIRDYIRSLFGNDEEISFAQQQIKHNEMPSISIAPLYGRLLTMCAKMINAKNILELGCLGGVGSIYLARGLSQDGKVISLEAKEKHAQVARETIRGCTLEGKIEVIVGDALTTMSELEEQQIIFDLIFIDANKSNYPAFLEQALALSKPGTIIAADNTLSRGKVIDQTDKSEETQAIRTFNRMALSDNRLEATLLPSADGFVLARVND